jgi:hypothetical protein
MRTYNPETGEDYTPQEMYLQELAERIVDAREQAFMTPEEKRRRFTDRWFESLRWR